MRYIEQNVFFDETQDGLELSNKSISRKVGIEFKGGNDDAEIMGVRVRLGNQPIVTNLRKVLESIHGSLPPKIGVQFQEKEIYTIVHAIGVTRLKGRAEVDELHYDAEMIDESGKVMTAAQTIDLIPHTRFKEVLSANVNFGGSLSVTGNAIAEIPEQLSNHLLQEYLSIGGAMNLQLSTSSSFVGKFTYNLKFPIVISTGIASNTCHWVLKPNENQTPLLGDQLLIQTIAVPIGLKSIRYRIKGTIKVDKGLFSKQQTKHTDEHEIEVCLV